MGARYRLNPLIPFRCFQHGKDALLFSRGLLNGLCRDNGGLGEGANGGLYHVHDEAGGDADEEQADDGDGEGGFEG